MSAPMASGLWGGLAGEEVQTRRAGVEDGLSRAACRPRVCIHLPGKFLLARDSWSSKEIVQENKVHRLYCYPGWAFSWTAQGGCFVA